MAEREPLQDKPFAEQLYKALRRKTEAYKSQSWIKPAAERIVDGAVKIKEVFVARKKNK